MSGGLFDGETVPTISEQLAKVEDAARLVLAETARLRELLITTVGGPIVKEKRHPIRDLLTRFDQAHQKRFNLPAPIVGARDSAIMQRLLKQYEDLQIATFIDLFFELDDDWTLKRGFTVAQFSTSIGQLIAASSAPRRTTGLTPRTEGNRANAATAAEMIKRGIK